MTFKQPVDLLNKQKQFSEREVGLIHPDLPSFIRLADNGDIQIMINGEVGIIISEANKSIALVADSIKFVSKKEAGLKWNDLSFNPEATKYNEPTFVRSSEAYDIYSGIEDFLDW